MSGSYITEDVLRFLADFRESVRSGNAGLVWDCIAKFEAITEETFKVSQWPARQAVEKQLGLKPTEVHEDFVFINIYGELQHRHSFNRCDINDSSMLATFYSAWHTYTGLLRLLIENDRSMPEMSSAWLWDCIDGFVSHFQYWHNWKAKTENAAQLIKLARESTNNKRLIQSCWNVQSVVCFLQVGLARAGGLPLRFNPPISEVQSVSQFQRLLGLFGLIGLLRVHSLTCDYGSALECMDSVDLRKKSPITHNELCLLTAQYYLGFSFLMCKRWLDAHNVFSGILCRCQPRSDRRRRRRPEDLEEMTAIDVYAEKHLHRDALVDKCYALLAIVEALCPQRLDKALVGDYLKQTHGNEIEMIRSGMIGKKEDTARELFLTGAPDFLNVCDLWFDSESYRLSETDEDYANMAAKEQFDLFWQFAKRRDVSIYKQDLKLYRTIALDKLAIEMATLHTDTFNLLAKAEVAAATVVKTVDESKDAEASEESGSTLAELTAASIKSGVSQDRKVTVSMSDDDFQKQLIQLKCSMKQYRRDVQYGFGASVYSKGTWTNEDSFDFKVGDGIVTVSDADIREHDVHRYSTSFLRQIRLISECMDRYNLS